MKGQCLGVLAQEEIGVGQRSSRFDLVAIAVHTVGARAGERHARQHAYDHTQQQKQWVSSLHDSPPFSNTSAARVAALDGPKTARSIPERQRSQLPPDEPSMAAL